MTTLSVVTYNIHGCRGLDWREDPERIARVLRRFDADIIGLQEVSSAPACAGEPSQLDRLARLIGRQAIAGPTLLHTGCRHGTALLTRYPLASATCVDLSVADLEPRGALVVDTVIAGISARIVVTHLGLGAAERRWQSERLLEWVEDGNFELVLLLGDINEWWPFSMVLKRLHERLGKRKAPRTYPTLLPVFALDRVWVYCRSAKVRVQVRSVKDWAIRVASDHLPLHAKIALDHA